jgi:peptide/nickel transport system ATP-binding protein
MSDDTPILSLEDVEVHFENQSASGFFGGESRVVRAVDGVSIDIEERDVIALVGESGCGKTTLGKTAIGLQRPTGGSVKYRGHDIWEVRDGESDADIEWSEIRRSLQIIHQDPGASLNPNRRLNAILSEPLQKVQPDLSSGERRARIYSLLERVGMNPAADFAERYPHELSGGEKQRVALCRALLMNPDVILADEAISALDVSLRVEMMDLMLELQDEFDTSFVFISHDLSNARYFAQHADGKIGVMYLGQLAELGSAQQIIGNPQHPYTEVLRWSTPDLAETTREEHDIPMRKIDIPDPVNPPSGCRFHTRCPKAREVCTQEDPDTVMSEESQVHCYRAQPEHEYWDSEPLEGTDAAEGEDESPDAGYSGTD